MYHFKIIGIMFTPLLTEVLLKQVFAYVIRKPYA